MFSFLSYYCIKIDFKQKQVFLFKSVLILLIAVFIGKNIYRIYKSENNYNNYPWPKYYAMTVENILTDFNEIKINNTYILTPKSGYCMYIKKVCSQYKVDKKLKIKEKYGYKIF